MPASIPTESEDNGLPTNPAFRRADDLDTRLAVVRLKMPSIAEMNAIETAIGRAREALDHRSVVSAIKDEDASHITGRIALVIAQLNSLYIASEYLVQLAEKLRADANALADSIEQPDDSQL